MTIDSPNAARPWVTPASIDSRRGSRGDQVPRPAGRPKLHVLYLAHDLNDAAIWRRDRMLAMAGARVTVAGFRRRAGPLAGQAIVLGGTEDGRLFRRALTVAGAVPGLAARLRGVARPDAILARNLEMLVLAMRARRLWPGPPIRIVYEVLDIHRMMLGDSTRARLLRSLERRLTRSAALALVSSPGFVKNYFVPYDILTDRLRLVENKVIGEVEQAPPVSVAPDDVITIGWFGILRCEWTLRALDALTRAVPGRFRVVARGIPTLDKIPDFHEVVDANPDLEFGGAYVYPDDLAAIYGRVHIVWMVDRYDAGQNSDWLLPNRLYEGGLQGRVPLALEGTEIASFLRQAGIGLILPRPDAEDARILLTDLAKEEVGRLGQATRALPSSTWVASEEDCRALLTAIVGSPMNQTSQPIEAAE